MSLAGEKAQVPKEIADLLRSYAGNWSVEGGEGETPLKGTASFRMPPGNHCIVGTVSARIGEEPFIFSLVTGWDSSTGWCTEVGVGSDGSVYRLEWRNVSPALDEGKTVGTFGGKQFTEKARLERKSRDHLVATITDRMMGDKKLPDMTLIYRRVAKEKGKSEAKQAPQRRSLSPLPGSRAARRGLLRESRLP
jgi:hypothetical protein